MDQAFPGSIVRSVGYRTYSDRTQSSGPGRTNQTNTLTGWFEVLPVERHNVEKGGGNEDIPVFCGAVRDVHIHHRHGVQTVDGRKGIQQDQIADRKTFCRKA